MAMLAENARRMAKRLVSGKAGTAGAAKFIRIEYDAVASGKAAVLWGFKHFAHTIDAHDQWEVMGHARAIVPHIKIDAIDRGGKHPHPRKARRVSWARHIHIGDASCAALFQNNGFHDRSSRQRR
jgi:hypothetical protein